jgi:3-hydroxyisobutyrate dehydrogenase
VLGRTEAGIERAVRGKIVALLSTVDPSASQALGAALADAGAEYVEAPVAGSAVQAEEATLLVLASAARRDTVERLAPVLAAIGQRTIWCGPPPGAMTVKLANNLVQIGLRPGPAQARPQGPRARPPAVRPPGPRPAGRGG